MRPQRILAGFGMAQHVGGRGRRIVRVSSSLGYIVNQSQEIRLIPHILLSVCSCSVIGILSTFDSFIRTQVVCVGV